MTTKEKRIDDLAMKAYRAIQHDWERCDGDTGEECRGAKCLVGAHRAMVYIHRIMDEVAS